MKIADGEYGNAEAQGEAEESRSALRIRRRQAATNLLGEVHAVLRSASTRATGRLSGGVLTVMGGEKAGWQIGARVVLRRSGRMEAFSLSTPDVHVSLELEFNASTGEWEPSQTDAGYGAPTARERVVQAISQVLAASKRRPVDRIWADVHSETLHIVKSTFRK